MDTKTELAELIVEQSRDNDLQRLRGNPLCIRQCDLEGGAARNGSTYPPLEEGASDGNPEPIDQLIAAEAYAAIMGKPIAVGILFGLIGSRPVWDAAHVGYDPRTVDRCPACGSHRRWGRLGSCLVCSTGKDGKRWANREPEAAAKMRRAREAMDGKRVREGDVPGASSKGRKRKGKVAKPLKGGIG